MIVSEKSMEFKNGQPADAEHGKQEKMFLYG
jgi:hypothetical protein